MWSDQRAYMLQYSCLVFLASQYDYDGELSKCSETDFQLQYNTTVSFPDKHTQPLNGMRYKIINSFVIFLLKDDLPVFIKTKLKIWNYKLNISSLLRQKETEFSSNVLYNVLIFFLNSTSIN